MFFRSPQNVNSRLHLHGYTSNLTLQAGIISEVKLTMYSDLSDFQKQLQVRTHQINFRLSWINLNQFLRIIPVLFIYY